MLTGGFTPPAPLLAELRREGLFTFGVETDTFTTAQAVADILVKTHPSDTEKITTIKELVSGAIDTDLLLERL